MVRDLNMIFTTRHSGSVAIWLFPSFSNSESRGNVSGEELRMGLHDLGFKLSDADLSSIMAVIATKLNPSWQCHAVVWWAGADEVVCLFGILVDLSRPNQNQYLIYTQVA